MSESKNSDTEPLAVGYYVIEGPHQDPANVIAGPMELSAAERTASMCMDPNATVMHTPGLVYSIQEHGYRVEWADGVEKPSSLRAGQDHDICTDGGSEGGLPWSPPYRCPSCSKKIEYFIEVLGIRGNCPHCYSRVSHRIARKLRARRER